MKDLRNAYVTLPSAACIHTQGSSFIHNVKRNIFRLLKAVKKTSNVSLVTLSPIFLLFFRVSNRPEIFITILKSRVQIGRCSTVILNTQIK